MSDTGPAELGAIVNDEVAFKIYVIKKLEEATGDRRVIIENQRRHEIDDARHFADGDARMAAIENSIDGKDGVRSGVNDIEKIRNQFTGGWKALAGLVMIGAAAYGMIQALAWFVEKLKP